MVFSHNFWGHPAEYVAKVRDVVEFTAAENDSSSEVKYFLEPVEVFLGAVAIDCEAVLDS